MPNKTTKEFFDVCLPFEKPIVELEKMILEMKESSNADVDLSAEIKSLEKKLEKSTQEIFQDLTPWQRVQAARHPMRPYTLDYIEHLITDFFEVHGDRRFSDDAALVTSRQADLWARGIDSWDVCDGFAYDLMSRTPMRWRKPAIWERSKHEFVRRTAHLCDWTSKGKEYKTEY